MQNRTHAWSAAALEALYGTYVAHMGRPLLALSTAVAFGAGTLMDLDTHGSAPAEAFGWVTERLAGGVHVVSGGHREETHTVFGDAIFASVSIVALWAERFRLTLWHHARFTWHGPLGIVLHHSPVTWATNWGMLLLIAYLALLFGAGMKALRILRRHDLLREAIAIAGAAALGLSGYDAHGIALAVLIGATAHALGDSCTEHMIQPFLPVSKVKFSLLPKCLRIRTGHAAERYLVLPAMVLAVAFLAARAIHVPLPHLERGKLAL
jgi:membrane-bound metal-dependent hydrolase YbcI (DUF457 family)